MRFRTHIAAIVLLAAAAGPAAHATHSGSGYPDCVSGVGVAGAGAYQLTDFSTHGFGGDFIGSVALPAVAGVIPAPTAQEADVVGALLNLNFVGVLGGGTTTIRPLAGLPGATVVHAGAQVVTSGLFTGHYRAVPKTYTCESVTRPLTIVTNSYFEITISGLLTPLVAGSPLAPYASGLSVGVSPGNNAPQ